MPFEKGNKFAQARKAAKVATATIALPPADEVLVNAPAVDTAPDYPAAPDTIVEVWERRFNNPRTVGSTPIQLKVPGMVSRWVNTSIDGRYHRAVYDQGWQPVQKAQLKDPESIPDLYNHPHGIVCRGERGKEVLMMMPQAVFDKIQRRKADLNTAALHNMRNDVSGAASSFSGRGDDTVRPLAPEIRHTAERVSSDTVVDS